MNLNEIKDLIKTLNETEITELSLESDGVKVKIKKRGASSEVEEKLSQPQNETAGQEKKIVTSSVETPVEKQEALEEDDANLIPVVAPMVGTFYRAPSPDAEPYVQVGDVVKQGQTLCILEAMKLFNEIESEIEGKVVKILVDNAEPVEYGQTLFLIEKI